MDFKKQFEGDIHKERNLSKARLDFFSFYNEHTVFDNAISESISEKERSVSSNLEKLKALESQVIDEFDEEIIDFNYMQQMNVAEWIYYDQQELKVLVEMQIIYAFKVFEIKLKQLFKTYFKDLDVKSMHRWETVISFCKLQNIKITEFDHYNDVIEFKLVNNLLKHSDSFSNEIKSITEFKNETEFTYENLNGFYKNRKDSLQSFIYSLSLNIYEVLYNFDDYRIISFAHSIASRMEREDVVKLITFLKEIFDINLNE